MSDDNNKDSIGDDSLDAKPGRMTIVKCQEDYDYYSGKVSEIVRNLGLAGIAIVWIFKNTIDGHHSVPPELFFPTMLLILGLSADLLQYFVSAKICFFVYRSKEKKGLGKEDPFVFSEKLTWPGFVFYYTKVLLICWAYVLLFMYIGSK